MSPTIMKPHSSAMSHGKYIGSRALISRSSCIAQVPAITYGSSRRHPSVVLPGWKHGGGCLEAVLEFSLASGYTRRAVISICRHISRDSTLGQGARGKTATSSEYLLSVLFGKYPHRPHVSDYSFRKCGYLLRRPHHQPFPLSGVRAKAMLDFHLPSPSRSSTRHQIGKAIQTPVLISSCAHGDVPTIVGGLWVLSFVFPPQGFGCADAERKRKTRHVGWDCHERNINCIVRWVYD